jgi:hypothetical protein
MEEDRCNVCHGSGKRWYVDRYLNTGKICARCYKRRWKCKLALEKKNFICDRCDRVIYRNSYIAPTLYREYWCYDCLQIPWSYYDAFCSRCGKDDQMKGLSLRKSPLLPLERWCANCYNLFYYYYNLSPEEFDNL